VVAPPVIPGVCLPLYVLSAGVSVGLYFRFVKNLIALFVIMTVLALPILYLAYRGGRVNQKDVDPLGISVFSLANVNADISRNTTAFGYSVSPADGSQIIGLCDLAYSLLFLLFIWYWGRKLDATVDSIDEEITMTSDYSVRSSLAVFVLFVCLPCLLACLLSVVRGSPSLSQVVTYVRFPQVMVTGLPRNTTVDAVLQHFNNLYDLTKPDWTFGVRAFHSWIVPAHR
jgi:hypothetical protein